MPTDTYGQIVNSPVGRFVARRAGLPQPVALDRHTPGDQQRSSGGGYDDPDRRYLSGVSDAM